jgi:hypothetical protein
MDPELEQLEASFNKKIEQWISKQGLIFQFTHNTGSGSLYLKLYGLFLRLLLLGVIGLLIFWFYLASRPSSEAFKQDLKQQLAAGLNSTEVEISGVTRDKGGMFAGELSIASLALGETQSSFFEDWYVIEEEVSMVGRRSEVEMKNRASVEGIHLSPLGIGDNYFVGWSGKELSILKMELKLKTGAESDALAMAAYSSLFKKYETLNIDSIQVFDANLLWGYSETSAGSIKGAQLNIVKNKESWEINIIGGRFSHSWLKDAVINKMKVTCDSSGQVVIESASFSLGDGELKLNASIQIQAQPELKGNYSIEDVEVLDLIGDSYKDWLGGTIDGTGEISGKLNTAEGIKVTTTVDLDGASKRVVGANTDPKSKDSVLMIRGDNIQLLKIMQIKDPRNSYSLLRAHQGKLIIENQGKNSQITVIDMRCGLNDLILMKGKFDYVSRPLKPKDKVIDASDTEQKEKKVDPLVKIAEENVSEKNVDMVRVFSGELELGLIPEAFESNIKVLDVYPVDNATLRVWFNVKLDGQLEELTEDLANKLFNIMKKDENN